MSFSQTYFPVSIIFGIWFKSMKFVSLLYEDRTNEFETLQTSRSFIRLGKFGGDKFPLGIENIEFSMKIEFEKKMRSTVVIINGIKNRNKKIS